MSECGPDCDCPESLARKLMVIHHVPQCQSTEGIYLKIASMISNSEPCPQACGKAWPECGCPTAEIKQYVLDASQGVDSEGRRKRSPGYYHGRSLCEMMNGLQGRG